MTTYFIFDHAGFYVGSTNEPQLRSTEIEPSNLSVTEVPGEIRSNWTGYSWIEIPFIAIPAPTVLAIHPWQFYIDIGPFFDRFGVAKMAVLMSADATVQAILRDVQVRKWIDLKRIDVAQSLAYIGSKVPALNAALQESILQTPVSFEENMALRKLYFS